MANVSSLFDFLEPQKPKVQIPYRAPAEIEAKDNSIVSSLKPGEKATVTDTAPGAKSKLTYTGGKGIVGEKQYPTEQYTEMAPDTIDIPIGEKPSPDVTDQELEDIMPEKTLEEKIADTVKNKPHEEKKQIRNDMVVDEQTTQTRDLADDSSAWDDIWPALIPIATNALIGDGTYDVAFEQAADVIRNIQKDKLARLKAQKVKSGSLSLADRMALEDKKFGNQKELQQLRGEQGIEKLNNQFDNKLIEMRSSHGNKIIEDSYKQMGMDNRQIEKLKNTPIDIIDPGTKTPKAMSAYEYFSLPLEQRPQKAQKNVGSQRPIVMQSLDKNTGEKTYKLVDPITKQEIRTDVMSSKDEALPGLDRGQYNAIAKPTVDQYEKVVGDAVEKEKDMTFAYEAFLSENSTAALGALITTMRALGEKGTLTNEDYNRYRGEVSIVHDYYRRLVESGSNQLNPELLGRSVDLAKRMISMSQRRIDEAHKEYTNILSNKTKGKNIPKETWAEFLGGHTPDRSYLDSLKKIEKEQANVGKLGRKAKLSEKERRLKELEERE